MIKPKALSHLADALSELPGIGKKMAQRIAFHVLKMPQKDVQKLARALLDASQNVGSCSICFGASEGEICQVCSDESRDKSMICVVEEPSDVFAVEKAGAYRGVYHVLRGAIAPLDGIGPEDLKVKELQDRLSAGGVVEVVVATDLDLEGEATAMYIARALKGLGAKVTRIAHGIPLGADLEFADEVTLGKSFEGRREMEA